jgi:hypothetical protein
MDKHSITLDVHQSTINLYTSLGLHEWMESMYSKSIPLGFFGTDSESRDTALFTSTVFESRGRRGFGKCCRDLDSVV